jgi:arsenate reductase
MTQSDFCDIKRAMSGTRGGRVQNVLFVCVGNSCRSQMAEALANHYGNGRVRAWSAGSRPLGEIIPQTYEVMQEKGISLEGHKSKKLDEVPVGEMDVVVGMGCEVACPLPVGFKGRVIEWNIPDPYGRELSFFRSVRDSIQRQVIALLNDLDRAAEREQAGSTEAAG